MGLLIAVLLGKDPFPFLGMATPPMWTWATSNKLYACMMIFFVGNAVEGQLISTGAFEVSFNDVPVWSKLENGRVPSPQEMFQILDNQIKMGSTSGAIPADDFDNL